MLLHCGIIWCTSAEMLCFLCKEETETHRLGSLSLDLALEKRMGFHRLSLPAGLQRFPTPLCVLVHLRQIQTRHTDKKIRVEKKGYEGINTQTQVRACILDWLSKKRDGTHF